MKKIGIISGEDAIKFKNRMENPTKLSPDEYDRIIHNYNKIKSLGGVDNESIQEKIRNHLSPYWNIVSVLDNFEKLSEDQKKTCWTILKKDIETIKKQQEELLTLIDSTYEKKSN